MATNKKDIVSIGVIAGLIIPALIVFGFVLYSSSKYDSFMQCLHHFQNIGLLYKIVSLSLMPGAGLFFLWSKQDKLNQARGALLSTMFYGILVLILYMS
ncbi:MAG: hypothetical protein JEZ09_01235 [Salinivirgaceae bacterium]|nr:hypothetical protein [Salinivirgaceae bacterium]